MDNLKSGFERRIDGRKSGISSISASNGSSAAASPELNRFRGKLFYFDDECQREINYKDLVRWLKYIGADVEVYHTNKITHYISKSGRKPEAEKPGPVRRPPARSRALSRKDLMLAAVRSAGPASPANSQTVSPPDSQKRGIRYFSYDKLIPLVKRQVRAVKENKKSASGAKRNSLDSNKSLDSPVKSPKVTKPKKPTTAYPQTSRRSLFIETRKSGDSKSLLKQNLSNTQKTYLKDNFIKITDESEKFRPIFKDKMQEQILSRERVAFNKCPFVGSMTHEERKAKRDSLQLQKQKKYEGPGASASSSASKTTSAIVAGAKNDASKTLATMWKSGGTCEICNYSRYEDPAEHFESENHKKNISNYEARFRMIDNAGLKLDSGVEKEEASRMSKTQLRVKIIQHRMKKFAEKRKTNPSLADLERMKSPVSQEETAFRDKSMQKLREKTGEEVEKQEETIEEKPKSTVNQAPVQTIVEEPEKDAINEEEDQVQENLAQENFHKIDDSFEICLKKPLLNIDVKEKEDEKQLQNIQNEDQEAPEENFVEIMEEKEAENGEYEAENEMMDEKVIEDIEENDADAECEHESEDEMMDAEDTEALKSLKDDEETRDDFVITSRYSSPTKSKLLGSACSPQKTIQLYQFEKSSDESSSEEEIKPSKTKPKRLSTFINYSCSSSSGEEEQLRLPKAPPKKQNESSFNLDTTNEESFNESQNSEIPKPRIIYPKRKREALASPQLQTLSPGNRSPARKRSQISSNLEFDRIESLPVEASVNVIDDMLNSSPIQEEIKEPVEQINSEPNFEQKEEIQEDQIVPEAEKPTDYEEESTVEATTATEVTVQQDFKRKTWNFEHFGSDENSRISGCEDGSLQNAERITLKSERGWASIQFSDESNSTKMSCNVDSANFVEELPLRELQTRKPVKWERPFVFSALERPQTPPDNNEENQNETLCTVAEDASFNSQLSLNHSAHHGSINLCEEEAADHLPDENKPWNHPCQFPPKRYASLKSEVEPETLIQMISEEQEQFNGLERYCDPKTRYYSSFNEIKTTELIDRRVAEGRARKAFILGSSKSDQLKKRRSSVLAANRTSACLIQQKSSSPEPNDFEENAQCSWDHSMDKNGVHTLQVDQKSSELGISVPPDRSAFKIANNAISTNLDFEQILDSGTLDCQADFHSAGAEQAFVDSLDHEQKRMHFQYGAVRSSTRKPTILKAKKYAESDDDEYIPEYKYSSVPKSSKKKRGRPRKNAL